MRVIMALLLAILCCGFGATAKDSTYVAQPDSLRRTVRHTDAVKQLTIHRDTSRACDIWSSIIAEDSTYAPALYYLSRLERDGQRRIKYAYGAFAADTMNKWYTENYAAQLIAAHQYTRAIPIYRRLMRLDPKNLQSYHALAIIYGTSGMPYSAIAILDSAELRVGYNHYLAEIKQHLLLDTRQYDKAIEAGLRRAEEHPYDSDARTSLALTYDAAGRDSMARITLEEAFRIDTTDVVTISSIVDYYRRKGNTQRMLDYDTHYYRHPEPTIEDKLLRLEFYTSDINTYSKHYLRIGSIIQGLAIDYPNNRGVIQTYASHMIAGGDYDYALAYLRRHLDDTHTTAEDYIGVLQLEHYMEHHEVLQSDMERALERFPDSVALLSFSGYILSSMGQYDAAIKRFKHGLESATTDVERSDMLGYIGDVYHEIGNDSKAFVYYRKALKRNPDNILVLNNYAYFLSLLDRDLDRALKMAMRAVSLEPDNASYVDTYAWVLHRLGENDTAKQVMRQALSLSGQRDASLLAHYGDILWALGERFMAETYWQKAIDRGYDREEMEQHIATLKSETLTTD